MGTCFFIICFTDCRNTVYLCGYKKVGVKSLLNFYCVIDRTLILSTAKDFFPILFSLNSHYKLENKTQKIRFLGSKWIYVKCFALKCMKKI